MKASYRSKAYRPFDESIQPPSLLLAEDDGTLLRLMELRLKAEGYTVMAVSNGTEAWAALQAGASLFDAAVFDNIMPGMDGLDLVKCMKADPAIAYLPVVMHTASDRPEQIVAGIEAGVFYYLVKPCPEEVLHAVVAAAVRQCRQHKHLMREFRRMRGAFQSMQAAQLNLRTLEDAENAVGWLAQGCWQPEFVLDGLAALLINAVEHGIAEVGFEGKEDLLAKGSWRQEVNARVNTPHNAGRRVTVSVARDEDGTVCIEIDDGGKGFDWKKYDKLDPARAQGSHGRGIALARRSLDEVTYNAAGNRVTVVIRPKSNDETPPADEAEK